MHIESEADWLVALPERSKLLFLAQLSLCLTVAARESYEVGAEGLVKAIVYVTHATVCPRFAQF